MPKVLSIRLIHIIYYTRYKVAAQDKTPSLSLQEYRENGQL
jgi:hypothetical protein